MNGPKHYGEGERLLAESEDASLPFAEVQALAARAQAHFLAALTASHATAHHPESVGWDHAINPKGQP
jgi:hypothetical protein